MNNYIIKVDKTIKPKNAKDRIEPNIIEGETYYVSNSGNIAYRCKVLDIMKDVKGTSYKLSIEIYYAVTKTSIEVRFFDEIGVTPEQAVENQTY